MDEASRGRRAQDSSVLRLGGAFESIHKVSHKRVSSNDRRASMTADIRPMSGAPAANGSARECLRPQPADDADSLLRSGMAMSDAGDLDGALERLRQCVAEAPGNVNMLGNLGALEQRLGNYREAEEMYRRVLTLMPDHSSTLQCLANVLVLQGRYRIATPIYEKLLRLHNPQLGCKTALSKCYMQEGRWSEAVTLCDQILVDEPYHAGVISMRDIARHELREGDIDAKHIRALVSTLFLTPPPDYESIAALN